MERRLSFAAIALALIAAQPDTAPQPAAVAGAPSCQEDQVLVGSGAFEAGRWTAYECGPALDDWSGNNGN